VLAHLRDTEQLLFFAGVLFRHLFLSKASTPPPPTMPGDTSATVPYILDFKRVFEHFCMHAVSRDVLEHLQSNLGLRNADLEASRTALHRFATPPAAASGTSWRTWRPRAASAAVTASSSSLSQVLCCPAESTPEPSTAARAFTFEPLSTRGLGTPPEPCSPLHAEAIDASAFVLGPSCAVHVGPRNFVEAIAA
jgi:hypothetical protein